jgi:hypothetical protein
MGLSGEAMRFLLVLLALLSGLSLTEVAVAASPAEVVGRAELAATQLAPATVACPVRARIARAAVRRDTRQPLAPADSGIVQSCGVTIADQPHE